MANDIKLANVDDEQSLPLFMRKWTQHPAFRVAAAPFDLVKDSIRSALRLSTHWFRHLPTTVIVGAQKAGTTQLYACMVKHPRCFGAAETEVSYFSQRAERSVAWYRSRFPLRRRVIRRSGHVIEASSSYLPTPSALRQMKVVLPGARVVVLLRDPVSRAFSHYQHVKRRDGESRSFAEAVADELRSNEFPAKRGVALAADAKPMLGYVSRGYYALQLELLLKVYPRNKVLLIDSKDLFEDTDAVCERVFSFMGLESFDVEPTNVYNRGFNQEKIDPRVAERLREHYRPYDELLQEIFEKPFSWMAPPRAQAA